MTKSSPSEADTGRIIIGKVGKPHGIRGDLRVQVLTDFPSRFDHLREVAVGAETLSVENLHWHGETPLIRFRGYDNREKAAALTGKLLSLPREEALPLEEGEYYIFDIVGLAVYDEQENFLGTVREVLTTGANDVYVVEREGAADLLVPALKQVVKKIDLETKKMSVELLPEY